MPLHLTSYSPSHSPEPVESHLNESAAHTASTSHLPSTSSHQPSEASSSEIPNLADEYSPIPESSISSSKKHPEEKGPEEPAKQQKAEAVSPGVQSFLNELGRQGVTGNVRPTVEVKPRRVGGATYQVPSEQRSHKPESGSQLGNGAQRLLDRRAATQSENDVKTRF
jgi:Ribosomal protein S7p/S5e